MIRTLAVVALCAGLLSAQSTPVRPFEGKRAQRVAALNDPARYNELKSLLNLSDAQVTSLLDIQKRRNEALRTHAQQVRSKAQELRQVTQAESPNSALAGQLMTDIKNLRQQTRNIVAPFQSEAQNVLTADQKAKVAELEAILKQLAPARQAIGLGLIVPDPDTMQRPFRDGMKARRANRL